MAPLFCRSHLKDLSDILPRGYAEEYIAFSIGAFGDAAVQIHEVFALCEVENHGSERTFPSLWDLSAFPTEHPDSRSEQTTLPLVCSPHYREMARQVTFVVSSVIREHVRRRI